MDQDMPLVYSLEQAADKLGISRSTIYRFVRTGGLRTIKIMGRTLVPKSEIDRILKGSPRWGDS